MWLIPDPVTARWLEMEVVAKASDPKGSPRLSSWAGVLPTELPGSLSNSSNIPKALLSHLLLSINLWQRQDKQSPFVWDWGSRSRGISEYTSNKAGLSCVPPTSDPASTPQKRTVSLSQSFRASSLSHGEGNGNPLQYSCLGNPMERWAWRVTVHGAAKTRTQLRNYTTPPISSKMCLWNSSLPLLHDVLNTHHNVHLKWAYLILWNLYPDKTVLKLHNFYVDILTHL